MGLVGWLAGGGQFNESQAKEKMMTTKQMTLWQVIDLLAQQMPPTHEKLERVLGILLPEKERDQHLIHWQWAGSLALRDHVQIVGLDLVLGPKGEIGVNTGMAFQLDKALCISLDEVRERYGVLTITQHPRGRSLQETTVHSSKQTWGRLTFAFKEESPDCLFEVAFNPEKQN